MSEKGVMNSRYEGWRERFEDEESDLRVTEFKRLDALDRRREHLRERSHGKPGLHFDRAEAGALDWVLALIDLLDEQGKLPRLVKCKGGCGRYLEIPRAESDVVVWCDSCSNLAEWTSDDSGYELSDPKHPRFHEIHADITDFNREEGPCP